jgi:hypothetical protein
MNQTFREDVFRAGFRPCTDVEEFEGHLRGKLGMRSKYESAHLCLGRSLAEPTPPKPVVGDEERGKSIAGEFLFGTELDLWIAAIIMDGELGPQATVEGFRALVEGHWCRGGRLLREEMAEVNGDETRLMVRLAELLPATNGVGRGPGVMGIGRTGEIRLRVGSTSRTFSDDREVDFVLNGQATAPHIALIGKVGSGKTTTGVQIARQIVEAASVPLLFIDPKGEFKFNEPPPYQKASRGDGMTSDTLGRFYVTTALGVQVFDPTGRLCGVLTRPQPDKPLTSCVLSGPNRAYLYVTNGDKIFRRKTRAKGVLFFKEPTTAQPKK